MRMKTLFTQKTIVAEDGRSFLLEYYIIVNVNNPGCNVYGIEVAQAATHNNNAEEVSEELWGITDSKDVITSLVSKLAEFEVMPVHAAAVIDDLLAAS